MNEVAHSIKKSLIPDDGNDYVLASLGIWAEYVICLKHT